MNEQHPNTKLVLIYAKKADLGYYAGKVASFMTFYTKLGYTFPLTPLPITTKKIVEVDRESIGFFSGKKTTYKSKECCYYLEFPRELTEEELTFWRMFKIGFLCSICRPVGAEQNDTY